MSMNFFFIQQLQCYLLQVCDSSLLFSCLFVPMCLLFSLQNEFVITTTTGDFDSGVDTLPTASHIVKYDPIADQFIAMGTGASSAVFCLAQDPTNNFIYLGGSFSIINGNNWPFFAAYDVVGDTFSRIGTVDLDNWVWSIAVSPSGKIYIGGQMTGLKNPFFEM